MKIAFCLLFLSSSLYANYFWEPTEKDLQVLVNLSLKTPEEILNKRFERIEEISVGRLHYHEDFSCSLEGSCKYAASQVQDFPHKNLTF